MTKPQSEPVDSIVQEVNEHGDISNVSDIFTKTKNRWTPGNEYLWDDFDIETLVDTQEKQSMIVNVLLHSRITKYRMLRKKGIDIRGTDPFAYNN